MGNSHVTILELDLDALDFNLNFFKSRVNPSTKIMVVVKAFGYGTHELKLVQHLAGKVDYFAVAYVDEGIALRNGGINTPIMVLHPQKSNLQLALKHRLEPTIYSVDLLEKLIALKSNSVSTEKIHLKFNTGLNRLGFSRKDIPQIIDLLKSFKNIRIASVFSHIAASEDLKERDFSLAQISNFEEICQTLFQQIDYQPWKHMLNTSGIINYAAIAQFDMVRLGIGLYGFGNDPEITKQLQNVVTLTSEISQIHEINKGETIGYNRSYKAQKPMKTATIPIGHADGIIRQFSNGKGFVIIHDLKAPIVGNVCMDMIMVDVTHIENVKNGDNVYIYKNQQHIEELAANINTISYELLTLISPRVQRSLKKC